MIVGITGHQEIGDVDTIEWVSTAITNAIKEWNVTEGLTSLAAGTDQLFARILKRHGLPYVAVIPSKHYERTFNDESDYENYQTLLATAREVVTLKFDAPSEVAFFAAGKEVVNRSEMMFAVWNGKKAKGLGGTADAVKYALENNKSVLHFNPDTLGISLKQGLDVKGNY